MQTTHANLVVGETPLSTDPENPKWNCSFAIHGIRGIAFDFAVHDRLPSNMAPLVASGSLLPTELEFGSELVVQLTAPPELHRVKAGKLIVRIDPMPDASVVRYAGQAMIPFNTVAYASLSFSPVHTPLPPVHCPSCPLDLEAVAISKTGNIARVAAASEPGDTSDLRHSGISLTRCYDTYGPSIRVDLRELFADRRGLAGIFFVVSSHEPAIRLSDFQWIAVDVYVTGESSCHNLDGMIMATDPRMSVPLFHSRISVTPSHGATLSIGCLMTPLPTGVAVQPIQWSAPSFLCPLPVLSGVEIESELASLLGSMPKACFRRILCYPGYQCILNRGLALNGFRAMTAITVRCEWQGSVDLDLMCLALDSNFCVSGVASFNHPREFGHAIQHCGDKKMDSSSEFISVDIPILHDNAVYLAFWVRCTDAGPLAAAGAVNMDCLVPNGESLVQFRFADFGKCTGMVTMVLYRNPTGLWTMLPVGVVGDFADMKQVKAFVAVTVKTKLRCLADVTDNMIQALKTSGDQRASGRRRAQ
jgi:stress response protein SCP2